MNTEIIIAIVAITLSGGWMIHRVGYVGAAVWALILVLFAFMAVVPVALLGAKGYWITFAYMAVYAYWAHRTKVLYGLKLWPTRDSKDE